MILSRWTTMEENGVMFVTNVIPYTVYASSLLASTTISSVASATLSTEMFLRGRTIFSKMPKVLAIVTSNDSMSFIYPA